MADDLNYDDLNLTAGQKLIIDQLRHLGSEISADTYAYLNFGRDIEELGDEELESIPSFLLEPWLEEQQRAQKEEQEKAQSKN